MIRVIDGETLLLDDGREVRLIGARAPRADLAHPDPTLWPPAAEAKRQLDAWAGNGRVRLHPAGRRVDRYGRLMAHVVTANASSAPVWLQQRMIRTGLARAYALPGNTECLADLMAAEAEARADGLGFWADSLFSVRAATDLADLGRRTGRYEIVEGTVIRAARTKAMTYLNFGEDWRRDFTASIQTATVDKEGGAQQAGELANKRVRVRGWLTRRNGPMIELSTLAEVEVLAEDGLWRPLAPIPPVAN